MATYEQAISAVLRFKTEANKYQPILPVNTIDEEYYDIDKNITLREVLKEVIDYTTVLTLNDMYALTSDDVTVGSIISITATGQKYRVVDIANLNNASGYEAVTGVSGGFGGSSGTKINIKTYTSSDTAY